MKKVAIFTALLLSSAYVFAQDRDSTSDNVEVFNEDEFLDLDWESEGFTLTEVQEKSQQVRTLSKDEITKANAATVTEVLEKKAGLNVKSYGG